jgi:hypothetical protein
MYIEARRNIKQEAKTFRSYGYKKGIIDSPPLDNHLYSIGDDEVIDAWAKMKPEVYALTSILTDRVINRTINSIPQRQPFGLIESSLTNFDLSQNPIPLISIEKLSEEHKLKSALNYTLKRSLREELAIILDPNNTDQQLATTKSVYDRLNDLLNFRLNKIYSSHKKSGVEDFITGGIGTASTIMAGIIDLIPTVYRLNELKTDPKELAGTAKISYPLISQLAKMHIYDFGAMNGELTDYALQLNSYNPQYFQLTDTAAGKRLTINKSIKPDGEEFGRLTHPENLSGPATIGCPAMVNFDGEPAIKKLWTWVAEIGSHIYLYKYT